MITLYCWNPLQKAGLLLNPELLRTHTEKLRKARDVYWIDLEAPTVEEEKLVLEDFFSVHRLTREDITQRHHEAPIRGQIAKVEEFPDYLFIAVNPLRMDVPKLLSRLDDDPGATELKTVTQLSAVMTQTVLITHHAEPLEAIQNLRGFLAKHEEQAGRGPDYLFHLVLDAMVDEFAPVLDLIQDTLEVIEDQVFQDPSRAMLHRMLFIKRLIHNLRKSLIYEREVLARLVRGDFELIDDREIVYYRNVYDHVVRFTELMESAREMVNDLMQTHLSAASNRLNEVMKVLAMISTILLPMTVIAGVYGMNFEHMPELGEAWGYPFALGLMALVGGAALYYFKWKKWI